MPLFFADSQTLSGPYYYLPSGWNSAWLTAKANCATARATVVGIGDSITQGWGSSNFMATSWWARVRAQLLQACTLGADHYGMAYSAAIETSLGGPTTTTYPLVIAGTKVSDWDINHSGYNYCAYANSALSPFITCTPPYSVSGFDIVYDDYAPGTWTYQIDGGAPSTVTLTGDSTFASSRVKKVTISGLAPGAHTLSINATSGGAICVIFGVTAIASSSTGLAFANMGWAGMGLVTGSSGGNALSDASTFPVDRIALYQGFTGIVASPTTLSGLGFPSQPSLAIIAMGFNDAFQSVSRANFRDALDRLVWACRYGSPHCSIILLATWCPDGTDAGVSTVTNEDYQGTATSYRDIRAAMVEVAQNEQCAYVDVHGLFGRTPVTNGFITSLSDPHPTNLGHSMMAALVEALL